MLFSPIFSCENVAVSIIKKKIVISGRRLQLHKWHWTVDICYYNLVNQNFRYEIFSRISKKLIEKNTTYPSLLWSLFVFELSSIYMSSVTCLSVRLSVCLSAINFSHFIFFSRTNGPISIKLGTKHPCVRGFKFVEIKGHAPSKER